MTVDRPQSHRVIVRLTPINILAKFVKDYVRLTPSDFLTRHHMTQWMKADFPSVRCEDTPLTGLWAQRTSCFIQQRKNLCQHNGVFLQIKAGDYRIFHIQGESMP